MCPPVGHAPSLNCTHVSLSAEVIDSPASTTARPQSHDLLGWLIQAASHMRVSMGTAPVCYHDVRDFLKALSLSASWCLCYSHEAAAAVCF